MTKQDKLQEVERIKNDISVQKEQIGAYAYRLEEVGAIREAKALLSIVYKLEDWQNK